MSKRMQCGVGRRYGRRWMWVTVCGLAAMGLLPGGAAQQAHAGVARTDAHDYWHIQGARKKYKNVGKLNLFGTQGAGLASGVLISPRIILTAGHVVVSPGLGSLNSATIEIGGKTYNADKWAVHKKWNGTNLTAGTDLAMIRLAKPVRNVRPAKLATRGMNEQYKQATTVGFGMGGNGTVGAFTAAGTKRVGDNMIDLIEGPKKRILLYDFDGPNQPINDPKKDYPLALEYMAAPGDSGGGLFIGNTLVGITSFIYALEDGIADATFRDYAGFMRVQKWDKWIKKTERDLLRNRPGTFGTPGNPLGEGQIAQGWQQTWKGAPIAPALWLHGAAVPEPASAMLLGLGALLLGRRTRSPRTAIRGLR